MKNKSSIIISILIIVVIAFIIIGKFFYKADNLSDVEIKEIKEMYPDYDQVPKEVQEVRKKNVELKNQKPYLFMSPEELSSYDCNTILDSQEKKQCIDIQGNYKLSQLFKGLSQEQIQNYDCSKISQTDLIDRCNQNIKFMKEMNLANPNPKTNKSTK